jgi:uronate dehydrogenase
VSTEQPWEPILAANIVGLYNLYEAARKQGVKRVIFASSNHVMGFWRQDQVVDAQSMPRPDGLYGLSKAFGEDIARLYWDRFGIETLVVRIGSSYPEPQNRRMLATWLSYDDLERLMVAGLTAPVVGWSVIYGISDNRTAFYDNTLARHIGYRPQDSSDGHRARVEAAQPVIDLSDPANLYQGGVFVRTGHFD